MGWPLVERLAFCVEFHGLPPKGAPLRKSPHMGPTAVG
jgi:hypothetical protein